MRRNIARISNLQVFFTENFPQMSSLKLCEILSSIALRTCNICSVIQCDVIWCDVCGCELWEDLGSILGRFLVENVQTVARFSQRSILTHDRDCLRLPLLTASLSARSSFIWIKRLSSSTGHSFQGYQLPAIILMGGDYNPTCGWLLLRSILTPKPRLCWPGPTDKGGQVDSAGSNQSRHMGEVHR